jgi:NADP-dependent 3-hydroxy acid dehydrogenase YdfG
VHQGGAAAVSCRASSPRATTAPVVVVFGASSGIGRASAHRFSRRGSSLVLAARSGEALEEVAAECRVQGAAAAAVVVADVLDERAVEAVVDEARRAHGRIDVVVFSAGVMAYGSLEVVPSAVFTRVVDTPVHGTANVARAVVPVFREQGAGTLVVVTSLLASIPLPEMGAYIAGKWGQLALARTLQLETRADPHIHVCTVSPGAVDTSIYRSAANYIGRQARPPWPVSSPDDIADAVVSCVDRPRKDVSVGRTNGLITLGYRILPPLFDALAGPLLRRVSLSGERMGATDGNVFDPQVGHGPQRGAPPSSPDASLR